MRVGAVVSGYVGIMHSRAAGDSAPDCIDAIRDLLASDLDHAEDMGDREMRRHSRTVSRNRCCTPDLSIALASTRQTISPGGLARSSGTVWLMTTRGNLMRTIKTPISSLVCWAAVVLLAALTASTQASECSDFVGAYQERDKALDVYFNADSMMDRLEASIHLTSVEMETDAAAEALRRTITDETASVILDHCCPNKAIEQPCNMLF